MDLHEKAIDLMIKLDEKYQIDNTLSLDEYLYEYIDSLTDQEIKEIKELIYTDL
tara:strand:+ start:1851 stop:2012 length:162 start_codon:yes stop_codon:yes gene_type:complete